MNNKLMNNSISEYLAALSSDKSTPGGGSATAVMTAEAIALLLMSSNVSKKRLIKNHPEYAKDLDAINEELVVLRDRAGNIAQDDIEKFSAFMQAYRNGDEKEIALLGKQLPKAPLELLDVIDKATKIGLNLKPYIHEVIYSDYYIALILLTTLTQATIINIGCNKDYLPNKSSLFANLKERLQHSKSYKEIIEDYFLNEKKTGE